MSTMPTTLGLIEAFDRHGALLARAPITRWPVTVGRALDCDLVLDDPFVAPRHLRIDRAVNEPRTVQIEVLETRNGARLQRKQHGPGEHFDWPDGAPIDLGHTHITLRLADAQIADEQPLPQFPWRTVGTTAALVALVLLVGRVGGGQQGVCGPPAVLAPRAHCLRCGPGGGCGASGGPPDRIRFLAE